MIRAMPAPAIRQPPDARRRKDLAAIHAMRKELALTEDSYRAIVSRVSNGQTDTSAELSPSQRGALIEEMKRLGAGRKNKKSPGAGGVPRTTRGGRPRDPRAGRRPIAPGNQQAKIRALWLGLYHLGEIADPSEAALDGFVQRMTKISSARFLRADAADKVIKALRGWATRVGWTMPDAHLIKVYANARIAAELDNIIDTEADPISSAGFAAKMTLLQAAWPKLAEMGVLKLDTQGLGLGTWLRRYGVAAPWFLSPENADLAIERLGAWLRAEMKKREIDAPLSKWLARQHTGEAPAP